MQVARLGNPLMNELIVPTANKDAWNRSQPRGDARYDGFLLTPILAPVVNQLYSLEIPTENRTDLKAIFHQGLAGLNQFGSRVRGHAPAEPVDSAGGEPEPPDGRGDGQPGAGRTVAGSSTT